MKFKVSLVVETEFEAESEADARKKGRNWQDDIAGSNDGSEMLANADIQVSAVQ